MSCCDNAATAPTSQRPLAAESAAEGLPELCEHLRATDAAYEYFAREKLKQNGCADALQPSLRPLHAGRHFALALPGGSKFLRRLFFVCLFVLFLTTTASTLELCASRGARLSRDPLGGIPQTFNLESFAKFGKVQAYASLVSRRRSRGRVSRPP